MKTLYSRRSGGISKTLIFADFVTMVLAPTIGLLVETDVIAGRWGYIALGVVGLVTRFLRQVGPVPKVKAGLVGLALGVVWLGLSGCATTFACKSDVVVELQNKAVIVKCLDGSAPTVTVTARKVAVP